MGSAVCRQFVCSNMTFSRVGEGYLTVSEKRQLAPPQFLGHIAAQHIQISRLTQKDRAVDCCRANTHLVLRPPSLSIFYKFVLQPVEPALNLSEARDAVSMALTYTCKTAHRIRLYLMLPHLYESRSLLSPSPISLRNLACLVSTAAEALTPKICSAGRFTPAVGVACCTRWPEVLGGVFFIYPLILLCLRISPKRTSGHAIGCGT